MIFRPFTLFVIFDGKMARIELFYFDDNFRRIAQWVLAFKMPLGHLTLRHISPYIKEAGILPPCTEGHITSNIIIVLIYPIHYMKDMWFMFILTF